MDGPESHRQFVRIIASGSRGNATFVRLDGTGILVDAGVSRTKIGKGLTEVGLGWSDIDAIVVTHEHSDHIRSVEAVRKSCPGAEVFASPGTAREAELEAGWRELRPGKPGRVGRVDLHPFSVQHDAAQPLQVRLETSESCVVIATDLGYWDDEVVEHLRGAHVALLEANHDRGLLARGPYPAFLKRRVGGRLGHLSKLTGQAAPRSRDDRRARARDPRPHERLEQREAPRPRDDRRPAPRDGRAAHGRNTGRPARARERSSTDGRP